ESKMRRTALRRSRPRLNPAANHRSVFFGLNLKPQGACHPLETGCASCCAPDARVALRQPARDARGERGGSLDVQEVAEVRHDLEDTRVEQSTVLAGRRHDAAGVAALEL